MYDQLITYQSNKNLHMPYVGFIKYARLLELYYQIKNNNCWFAIKCTMV